MVVGGSECISFGGFEFTSARDTVSAHKFINAVTAPNPWCGHCESFANQCCHPSKGAGEKNDGEGGGKKTLFGHIVKEQNENAERNAHTQREEEMRW